MALLHEDDVKELGEIFSKLERPVTLHVVTDEAELSTLIDEVAATSGGKIVVETLDAEKDSARVAALGILRHPAIALTAEGAKGKLIHYGLPIGYEMATLVAVITDLGTTPPPLSPATTQVLDALAQDVHIQVFSTPT
jgi:alkyl hydroperoxide reductase subunit AhpF